MALRTRAWLLEALRAGHDARLVAEQYGVSCRTLRRWIAAGRRPGASPELQAIAEAAEVSATHTDLTRHKRRVRGEARDQREQRQRAALRDA